MGQSDKLAIVISGGGMRCAYSVGTLLAFGQSEVFQEYPKLRKPDLIVGISGSLGALAYKIAGQYDSFRNIWEKLLTTGRFINFRRWRMIMDIDYLVYEVFGIMDPFDVSIILSSDIDFWIAVTNKKTGKPEFFKAQDCRNQSEFVELMRAGMSPPFIYGKYVDFRNGQYYDGGVSAGINESVEEAFKRGATKVIAIDHAFKNPLLNILTGRHPFPKSKYKKDSRVLLIEPKKLPVGFLTDSENKIRLAIDTGYDEAINNPSIPRFLIS